jgi:hypothetical protein
LLAGGGNAEGMIFREIFGEDPADGAMKNVEFDKKNGVVKYTPDDGDVKYFSIATGQLYDKGLQNDELQGKSFTWEKASIYADEASLPISKKPQDAQPVGLTDNIVADGYCVVKGHDGVYSLYEDGSLVNRYVVDETLAYGSTDVYGSQDGPNYLQDCIRNGKYLIQQYKDDISLTHEPEEVEEQLIYKKKYFHKYKKIYTTDPDTGYLVGTDEYNVINIINDIECGKFKIYDVVFRMALYIYVGLPIICLIIGMLVYPS